MRKRSEILIYLDLQKALDAGLKFFLSANGVVLSGGDENGFIKPEFFRRVENADRSAVPGWEGPEQGHQVPTKDQPSTILSMGEATVAETENHSPLHL